MFKLPLREGKPLLILEIVQTAQQQKMFMLSEKKHQKYLKKYFALQTKVCGLGEKNPRYYMIDFEISLTELL